RVKHIEQLEAGKAHTCVRLIVESRAKTPKHRPFFVTEDAVRGVVEIEYELIKLAKEVSIAVSASVTAVGQEEKIILRVLQVLWSDKEPLVGKPTDWRIFPFAIALPAVVSHADKDVTASPASFPLPPSFSEKGSPAYIDYKLIATVRRRGLFKSNRILFCPFVYLPVSRAEPPARLRLEAYRDGTALVGPDGDPDGWQVCPPTHLHGTLFDNRQVDVEYTLAVARPLTHARGSPIPLSVTVISSDGQALDLLSTPASMRAHLIRFRTVGSNVALSGARARSDQVMQERVGTAYFWSPDAGSASVSGSRTVQGELFVRPDSKPSFVCPGFSLGYTIDLLPPQAAGFVPKMRTNDALVTQGIIVTTAGTPGVKIPSHAPPGYAYPEEADYTRSLGYLENGNQR
ncbi:hypothetical protein FOMPIDRAFT_1085269, partial [Fomitopsis schrenkii]